MSSTQKLVKLNDKTWEALKVMASKRPDIKSSRGNGETVMAREILEGITSGEAVLKWSGNQYSK